MIITVFILALLLLGYSIPMRNWFARWGTTSEERSMKMAGDALIAHPTDVSTGAVTIDAPPEDIWPWLIQLGSKRGGFYSYDWLDRLFRFLDRPSATQIIPEFQHLAVGDSIDWGPDKLVVAYLDPNRALAFRYNARGMEWVWQFQLSPVDHRHTRLVDRGTERIPHTLLWWIAMRLMEPAAFIMTRRMMLGVKQRAETLRRSKVLSTKLIGKNGN